MPSPRDLPALRRRSPVIVLLAALTVPVPAAASSTAGGVSVTPAATAKTPPASAGSRPRKGVRTTDARADADTVIEAATRRIGAGYRMGATGPGRYDCSGLTVEAFAAAGIALARTSYDQYKQGTAVPRNEIRAGDLVFFDTGGPGASHVGIATSRTTLISATTSRGVVEHRLNDAYWGSHYLGARRMAL